MGGSLNLVLLLVLVNFVSEFRQELRYISLRKYQFKPYSSPWLSAACAAAIEIIFFFVPKVIVAKAFLKLPSFHIPVKQKIPLLPRNLILGTFGILLIVFSTKGNQLYLLYSTAWWCCLLHLIKKNYLLKTFPRSLILMTQVSLCLFSLLELV